MLLFVPIIPKQKFIVDKHASKVSQIFNMPL